MFKKQLEATTYITNILVDHNGNVYLIGRCDKLQFLGKTMQHRGFLAKMSSGGETIWVKDFFYDGATIGNGVDATIDHENNLYVTGSFSHYQYFFDGQYISADLCDGFVGKISGDGNLQWVRIISGYSVQSPGAIHVNALGHIYVAGDFDHEAKFSENIILPADTNECEPFVARYDANGNCLWAIQGHGSGAEYVYEVQGDEQGRVFISGTTRSVNGFVLGEYKVSGTGKYINNSILAQLDSSGNVLGLWNGPGSYNYINCLTADKKGKLYAAGGCGEGEFNLLGQHFSPEKPAIFIMRLNTEIYTGISEKDQAKTLQQIQV